MVHIYIILYIYYFNKRIFLAFVGHCDYSMLQIELKYTDDRSLWAVRVCMRFRQHIHVYTSSNASAFLLQPNEHPWVYYYFQCVCVCLWTFRYLLDVCRRSNELMFQHTSRYRSTCAIVGPMYWTYAFHSINAYTTHTVFQLNG